LLDPDTFSCAPAEPGIRTLRELGYPLVLCSSKTRAELEYWRDRLNNHEPFIVENGGAIYIPRDYFPFRPEGSKPRDGYDVIEFGAPYRELVATLSRASSVAECPTIGFHQMGVAEICILTMLPVRHAELAKRREYDEPFEILGSGVRRLLSTIRLFGKNWNQDGRFYHITGGNDKAAAIRHLVALFARSLGEAVQERVITTRSGWRELIYNRAAEPAVTC
jgi:mannosyl-3-phosphoglycerate phosphatase